MALTLLPYLAKKLINSTDDIDHTFHQWNNLRSRRFPATRSAVRRWHRIRRQRLQQQRENNNGNINMQQLNQGIELQERTFCRFIFCLCNRHCVCDTHLTQLLTVLWWLQKFLHITYVISCFAENVMWYSSTTCASTNPVLYWYILARIVLLYMFLGIGCFACGCLTCVTLITHYYTRDHNTPFLQGLDRTWRFISGEDPNILMQNQEALRTPEHVINSFPTRKYVKHTSQRSSFLTSSNQELSQPIMGKEHNSDETHIGIHMNTSHLVSSTIDGQSIAQNPSEQNTEEKQEDMTGNDESEESVDITEKCGICLSMYETNDVLRRLPCSHEFHATCVDLWLNQKRTCPYCRFDVTTNPDIAALTGPSDALNGSSDVVIDMTGAQDSDGRVEEENSSSSSDESSGFNHASSVPVVTYIGPNYRYVQ